MGIHTLYHTIYARSTSQQTLPPCLVALHKWGQLEVVPYQDELTGGRGRGRSHTPSCYDHKTICQMTETAVYAVHTLSASWRGPKLMGRVT